MFLHASSRAPAAVCWCGQTPCWRCAAILAFVAIAPAPLRPLQQAEAEDREYRVAGAMLKACALITDTHEGMRR